MFLKSFHSLFNSHKTNNTAAHDNGVWIERLLSLVDMQSHPVLLLAGLREQDAGSAPVIALGRQLAKYRKKTLLIDADWRHPELHHLAKIPPKPGLIQVLAGDQQLDNAVTPFNEPDDTGEFLHLMPAGLEEPGFYDSIDRTNVRQLVSELKKRFDCTLVNTTCMPFTATPMMLAGELDGVLLQVRAFQTPRQLALNTCRQFQDQGIKTVGVLFSDYQNYIPHPIAEFFE